MIKWKATVFIFSLLFCLFVFVNGFYESTEVVEISRYEDKKVFKGVFNITDLTSDLELGDNVSFETIGNSCYWTVVFELYEPWETVEVVPSINFNVSSYLVNNDVIGTFILHFTLFINGKMDLFGNNSKEIEVGANCEGKHYFLVFSSHIYGKVNLTVKATPVLKMSSNESVSDVKGYVSYVIGPFEVVIGRLESVKSFNPYVLLLGVITLVPISLILGILLEKVSKLGLHLRFKKKY